MSLCHLLVPTWPVKVVHWGFSTAFWWQCMIFLIDLEWLKKHSLGSHSSLLNICEEQGMLLNPQIKSYWMSKVTKIRTFFHASDWMTACWDVLVFTFDSPYGQWKVSCGSKSMWNHSPLPFWSCSNWYSQMVGLLICCSWPEAKRETKQLTEFPHILENLEFWDCPWKTWKKSSILRWFVLQNCRVFVS